MTTVSSATRDKSFITAGADGSVVLRHLTSQRTIVELPKQPAPVATAVITQKSDGIVVVLENGTLSRFSVASPHPETTTRTLFGKVWYEGYPQPEFVWQSTGATDDFEPKLSQVPLIFGTIKATIYAPSKVRPAEAYRAFLSALEANGLTGKSISLSETALREIIQR